MEVLQLGVFAALLQVAGYALYGSKVLKRDIEPNPTSWLMFAYGTALMAVLEWDRDASFALLALPIACALSSVAIAVYALRRATSWWPEHSLDRFSFGFDVFLTLIYLSTWLLLLNGLIVESQKDWADILILVIGSIGTLPAFIPLLRQVYRHPHTEHAGPWIVWSAAYCTLSLATFLEVGEFNELFLYPFINALIHGAIAIRVGWWHWMRSQPII